MNMWAPSRPSMWRIVTPSAISRTVSTVATAMVSSSLPSAPPSRVARRRARAVGGASVRSVMAGLQQEGEGGAGCGGAARERLEPGRDGVGIDDREAPVVEADVLREQLR